MFVRCCATLPVPEWVVRPRVACTIEFSMHAPLDIHVCLCTCSRTTPFTPPRLTSSRRRVIDLRDFSFDDLFSGGITAVGGLMTPLNEITCRKVVVFPGCVISVPTPYFVEKRVFCIVKPRPCGPVMACNSASTGSAVPCEF